MGGLECKQVFQRSPLERESLSQGPLLLGPLDKFPTPWSQMAPTPGSQVQQQRQLKPQKQEDRSRQQEGARHLKDGVLTGPLRTRAVAITRSDFSPPY